MKTFGICPKCKSPMLNNQLYDDNWQLTCYKNTNHNIHMITTKGDFNVVERITVAIMMPSEFKDWIYAKWDFLKEELIIYKSSGFNYNKLPFFEPDFTQYDKLIKKLRTYITFS